MAIDDHPAMPHADLEPVLDWTKLAREDELKLVRLNGKSMASGRIDTIALDGSVFWILHNDGRGRSMVLPEDDVIVFRHRRSDRRHST